jgi:hypothetical protein
MNIEEIQKMHRATRIALMANHQRSVADAEKFFHTLVVQIVIGAAVAQSATLQSAVLTAINVGKRTFRGGVKLVSARDFETLSPLVRLGRSFHEVARDMGASVVDRPVNDASSILIGRDAEHIESAEVSVRIQVQGWRVAVTPANDPIELNDESDVPLTGLFGASLALSEVFSAHLQLNPEAGRRDIGMCLWSMTSQWREAGDGPKLEYLPTDFGIVGLGHLGQALAWTLGSLPYGQSDSVRVTLQDDDTVGEENLSTCVLTEPSAVGHRKTRIVSAWLEDHGFQTQLVEQRFETGDQFHRRGPALFFAGVDSAEARINLMAAAASLGDSVQIIDIGLGARADNFDEIALHSSPISEHLRAQWGGARTRAAIQLKEDLRSAAIRENANANSLDACGTVTFASTAVGVPFVGMAAASIAWAEALRRLATGRTIKNYSCRLRSLPFSIEPGWNRDEEHPVNWAYEMAGMH